MKLISRFCVAICILPSHIAAAPRRKGATTCLQSPTSSTQVENAEVASMPTHIPSQNDAGTDQLQVADTAAENTASAVGALIVDMGNGTTESVTLKLEPSAADVLPAQATDTTLTVTSAQDAAEAAPTMIAGPAASARRVRYGGVNIAGFDFHCTTDGTCPLYQVMDVVSNGSAIQQMQHFTHDDGLNTFRLPVSWQYLVNNRLGGQIDENNFQAYDRLVQGCLDSDAKLCILDVHNYARWNGRIIGQGGPSNDQFADFWSQLASRYAHVPNIAFDIMNEPHDLDIRAWARTVQAAVTAIRGAGATDQMILLPGTDYISAKTFVSSGSAQALSAVRNTDGTTMNLVYNIHRYLDFDGSGTHAECVTNNIDESFAPLAEYLRQNGRMAMLTETGGGPNEESCMQLLCEQMDFINQNSDVFTGVVTWAAGGFPTDYVISETPIESGNGLKDQPLVSQCIVDKIGRRS